MEKRIKREFMRQNLPWRYEKLDQEIKVSAYGCTDATILCPSVYPFKPPSIFWDTNSSQKMTFSSDWHWFVVCMRRESNRRFAKTADVCLCCQSPTCEWNVSRRIDEVVEYIMCIQDASLDPGEPPVLFTRLSHDLVIIILGLAWSA